MRFNLKAPKDDMLLRYARMGLSERIDVLPDFDSINSFEDKFLRYEDYIKQEISVLQEIGFDGYMILLQDVVVVSREISDFVECLGSINNSLTAFVLGITKEYEFDNLKNFVNFTPFRKKPIVNIVVSSHANAGCVGYIKHKFPNIIKNIKKRSIVFKDALKIKFIDLDIDTEVDIDDLDKDILDVLIKNKII